MQNIELKFDKKRNRVKYCPCGKRNQDGKFVPYVGYEKKGYCHSCGETFLPDINTAHKKEFTPVAPVLTSYYNLKMISDSGRNFKQNNFVQFLKSIFEIDEVKEAIIMYCIGTSRHWQGSTIFWQIDNHNKARHGKIMLYNSNTGKRLKNNQEKAFISSVRSVLKMKDFNLKQCLFGLHLINENETKTIALVEGEKTAIIMSIFKPEYIWMATGSKQGFKYEMLKPVKEYTVIAFPDKGEYNEWLSVSIELNSIGYNIKVNDWIENNDAYLQGTDLADAYLNEVLKSNPITQLSNSINHTSDSKTINTLDNQNDIILSNLEANVNKMGSKNESLWLLIHEFELTDTEGNEIRKVS